ncbi:MAG TPA: translation initiation factor IF-2 [Labilithrix sp.]|nr:translation initiation factor IF-2 [Labilithrix sp.]
MVVVGGSMSKVRVYEVAKQLNLDPKAVVGLFQSIGVTDVRNHMSSVDVDAVERLKRNLEKQKTHDVVQESIRRGPGTVLKRRAVAKPDAGPASSASVASPSPQPSSPALGGLDDVASRRDIAQIAKEAPSSRALPTKKADVLIPATRESSRTLARDVPEDRPSTAAAPAAAPSTREVAAVPPAPPSVRERPSTKKLAKESAPAAAPSEKNVPEAAPSTKSLPAAAGAVAPAAVAAVAPAAVEAVAAHHAPEAAPAAPPSAPASTKAVAEARGSSRNVEAAAAAPAPAPVEAPVSAPPPPAPPSVRVAPVEEAPRPVVQTEPPPAAPARASAAPKTGVEYWAGRPGVPMPTPMNAPRTGIGGGPASAMQRRVQYDPRAGANVARPGMRPGQQRGPGGMMGRGGMGGRGRPGMQPIRRGPVNVSTKEMSEHKKVIRIEENITLSGMAAKMSLKSTELLMRLLGMGMTGVHINTTLDADTAKILAGEFGWEVEDVAQTEEEIIAEARGEDSAAPAAAAGAEAAPVVVDAGAVTRPPVVTVMGHVDHGKTSLLDKIRKANVASGEAGGITQHIGAYKVKTERGVIVFLDTPGHEAFTAMRARGAGATDIVVLVVAADDGVMPQTKEAIAHAKAAKVPIIVAINKIDKPSAEMERVKRELVEQGLQPEEWGGDTIFVPVSAHTGEGIPQLLEMIGLQAEVLDLKANPKKPANGVVLEALLDRGRGPVARVLIQEGTLRVGDFVLAGPGFGKVRAMTNEHGKQVHEAPPSTPVEILGLSDVPGAGDPLHAVKDPKKAQEIADSRKVKRDKSLIGGDARISLAGLVEQMASADQQELRVIVKADVQGSLEALASAFNKLSTDRVKLSIIHGGVGAITEGDVNLAIASKAIVIGFNARPAGKSSALAEENGVEIRLYSIIYGAVDDVKAAMEGLLPTTKLEKPSGKAEIRAIFKIRGVIVAGSMVTSGKILRGGFARLFRDGQAIWEGKIAALKRFKDDVKEVSEGFECGISLDGYSEMKEKDIVESFEIEEIKQRL